MSGGALGGPSWLQAAHHGQPPGLLNRDPAILVVGQNAIGTQRDSDIVAIADLDAEKRWRRHPDHWKRIAVEADRLSEDSGITSEFALPEGIVQDGTGVASLFIVIRAEGTPENRIDAEMAKEFTADVDAIGEARVAAIGKVKPGCAPRDDAAEALLLGADLVPLRIGQIGAAAGPPARSSRTFFEIDGDELARVLDRQHFEADGINQFEDGCVRADAEGERCDGHECKNRALPQLPDAVAYVLQDWIEHDSP